MRAPYVFKDIYLRVTILIILGVLGTIAALTYTFLGNADHLIVLYGPDGNSPRFLGDVWDVWGMIVVGGFISLLNFSIANLFYDRIRMLSYALGYATLFFSILLFIAVAGIISTN